MPNNFDNQINLIASLLEQERYSDAILSYDNLLVDYPNNNKLFLFRASAKEAIFDYQGAIEDSTKAIEINPTYLEAYYFRACLYHNIEEFKSAIEDCSFLLNHLPNNIDVYCLRARCRKELSEFSDAIADCQEALKLNSNNSHIYLILGLIKQKLLKYEDAIVEYSKVLSIDPTHSEAFNHRAKCFYKLEYFEKALEDCNNAIKYSNTYAQAFELLGNIYYEGFQDIEKAICAYRIMLLLNPKNANYLFKVGYIYSKWNKRTNVKLDFFDTLGNHSDKAKQFFIDAVAYENRKLISANYYGLSFINLFPQLRTDLPTIEDTFTVMHFVGNIEFITYPVINKSFYFSDIRSFPDKVSDCPLLNSINQTNLPVQVSYDHIRVRSFCNINSIEEVENCISLWDRFANGHKGVVYKYRIKKEWLIKNEVYTNKISYSKDTDLELNCDSPESILERGLFHKHIGYSDENELRFVIFGDFKNKKGAEISWQTKGQDNCVFIDSIFLGLAIDKSVRDSFCNLAKNEGITIYQMMLNGPKFKAIRIQN